MGGYRTKHNIRRGGPKKQLTDRPCIYCGRMFPPIRATSKFCSHRCAGKHRFHIREETSFMEQGVRRMKNLTPQEKALYAESAKHARFHANIYTKGIGGTRDDLGHYVRSRWEANICRWLRFLGIEYEYEPDTFSLLDGYTELTYTPDVKIANKLYIEVKGWETNNFKRKKELITVQRPDVLIIQIGEDRYKALSKIYKDIIPGWEYDSRHGR